jgi:RNA polymerase sigma factor (sigma-70 family)
VADLDLAALVAAADAGDEGAWATLVKRFSGLVWSVVRAHGLGGADAADVCQTTWLLCVEHLGSVRQPESLGAWLATTARHESLRVLRRSFRQVPTDVDIDAPVEDDLAAIDARSAADEQRRALWSAFERLSPPCQSLLRVFMADPPPSYNEVAAALEMPIGSIGPTRGRCLERLRQALEAGRIKPEAPDSHTKEVTQ